MNDNIIPLIHSLNKVSFNVNSDDNAESCGVLLYISNSFAFKPRHDLDSCFYLAKSLESIFVEIVIPNKPNIIVGVVYRHPGMSLNWS